jgi:hypothetical protein
MKFQGEKSRLANIFSRVKLKEVLILAEIGEAP